MLRVLMVCLRPLVAAGVRSALQAVNDLQLLDEICESHNVLQQCHQLAPDVLLIQSSQFENSFYELTSQLHSLCPTTNILLLLEPDEDCTIDLQRFVQTGGGGGAILSDEPIAMLINALRTIGQSGAWFSQPLLHKLMQQNAPEPSAAEALGFNKREVAIIHLLVQGKTDYEIAQDQGIAERTVRYYLQKICDKLGVDTRVKIVVQALKQGIVDETINL